MPPGNYEVLDNFLINRFNGQAEFIKCWITPQL